MGFLDTHVSILARISVEEELVTYGVAFVLFAVI